MKHLYLLALLSLTACKLPHRQQFALDARVTVELPNQPHALNPYKVRTVKHPERMKIWVLRTLGGTYQLLRSVNPAVHIAAQDTTSRARGYARVEATLKAEHAQNVVARPFTVGGIEGREFTYNSFQHSTGKLEPRCMRSLVLDSVSYVFLFLPTNREVIPDFIGDRQQRLFLNSITVNP
ncbi:hypothetical protein [Hymenobacter cheonanensis]|uniref:hypothetical protein n=1 Tax=Hymenobacter sp. CA2-7 TaxID=3063993 RepID=UPI0027144A51|nr:hypothetical protein [Hymenobacter sp. CA2-7]MDO7884293.1 hypothetical protein [Hymenobacter sp. CA2-7]